MLGVPGFVAPHLAPSFSQELLMESLYMRGTVPNRRAPAFPSKSPQSPGKDKGQSEQSCDQSGLRVLGPGGEA